MRVDKRFHRAQFFGRNSGKMRKVEADMMFIHIRTGLLNVLAENGTECRLQEVRRRVVAHGGNALSFVDFGTNGVALL